MQEKEQNERKLEESYLLTTKLKIFPKFEK